MTTIQAQSLDNARKQMARARKELELARINDTHYRGVEYTPVFGFKKGTAPLFIEAALTPSKLKLIQNTKEFPTFQSRIITVHSGLGHGGHFDT